MENWSVLASDPSSAPASHSAALQNHGATPLYHVYAAPAE